MEKTKDYTGLLQRLIAIPSFSGEESETADEIVAFLRKRDISTQRHQNNVWALNKYFDPEKPTLLLNSHHDTVRPNSGYTRDPFSPDIENKRLYGLGSNDAGAALVGLLATFVHFYAQENLNYNLLFAATAEEENSGKNGIRAVLPQFPPITVAIVGEPTQMQLAIAEKGLLVIDAYAKGKPGHAAHSNTKNPIYKAVSDIDWLSTYHFPKESALLGKVKISVTQIEAGTQHNVVPEQCHFVIDVRVNEHYTNREVFKYLDQHTLSRLEARSFRHNSSGITLEHPLVKAGIALGRQTYGSPTLSDQAALDVPSLKLGPGDSTRSHQANEFICLSEIEKGIELYQKLLAQVL